MPDRQKVKMRFKSPEKFQQWKNSWHGDQWSHQYPWNDEFDALESCEYHTAILDEETGIANIWEIYSNKTGKIITTERVAILPEEMGGVEFELIDESQQDLAITARIKELCKQHGKIKDELMQIAAKELLSYDQFAIIQNIVRN